MKWKKKDLLNEVLMEVKNKEQQISENKKKIEKQKKFKFFLIIFLKVFCSFINKSINERRDFVKTSQEQNRIKNEKNLNLLNERKKLRYNDIIENQARLKNMQVF